MGVLLRLLLVPYPWCDHKALFDSMPDIDVLQALRKKIA